MSYTAVGSLLRDMRDAGLSPREREVLGLLADGHNHQKIAEMLDISVRTAREHACSIYRKLGVQSRTQAAVWYYNHRERK